MTAERGVVFDHATIHWWSIKMLRAHRNLAAARQFFERQGVPEKITAAIVEMRTDSGVDIEMRQSRSLNNLIAQDHRAIKRGVRPMLGFKSFRCARAIIAGIETMHMIKKGQLDGPNHDLIRC